jgi:hypothetical protein
MSAEVYLVQTGGNIDLGSIPSTSVQLGGTTSTNNSVFTPAASASSNVYQIGSELLLIVITLESGGYSNSYEMASELVVAGVLSISPLTGVVPMFQLSGTLVTITGSGFVAGTTVTFGAGSPFAPQSISSDGTTLVIAVPPGLSATSGPVTVTLPSGGTDRSLSFAVDNYRNTRGFSWTNNGGPAPGTPGFQNLPGMSLYTFDDATALFGANQTTINIFGFSIENPYVSLFRAILDATLDSNGQCFGFALGSLRFTTGEKSLSGLPPQPGSPEPGGPPGPDVWTLNGPPFSASPPVNVTPALSSFIHQQMMAQFSQESINQFLNFHANVNTAPGLRNAIVQAFNTGGKSGIGVVLGLDPELGVGHAVVAYEIVDIAGTNGNFDILLYNPNVPFSASEDSSGGPRVPNALQSVIHVMSDGTWTATLAVQELPNFAGDIFNITVIPWNTIPVQPTIPWAEISLAGFLATGFVWAATGDASIVQISDGQGHTLLANGGWNVDPATTLPGVRPLPAFGGLGRKTAPAFVSNRWETLTHTIAGGGTGSYDFNWVGGNCGIRLAGVPSTPGGNDIVVTDRGLVSFVPVADKAVTATFIGRSSTAGSLPRTATLKTAASARAAVALSFDPTADTFTYTHAGAATSYTVEFSSYDAQGKAVTYALPASAVLTGDTHIFAPDWADLPSGAGTVTIRHSDGTTTTEPFKPEA